jgi:2-polyprenyl-3-methyl-5-hydroxy-6-metoxy-1,4-benzoquinol methylase
VPPESRRDAPRRDPERRDVDPDRLKATSLLVFSKLEGAVTASMIHLGDRLGLYRALADGPPGGYTSAELAAVAGLAERWVREWLHNQGAARIVDVHLDAPTQVPGVERFSLSPEGIAVLADEEHPAFGMGLFHRMPSMVGGVDMVIESFRTGLGFDYDAHGIDGAVGIERAFAPWMKRFLVPDVLPKVQGMLARLHRGAAVADVGCGAGLAVLAMAEAFPESSFVGYDISQHALIRAREHQAQAGLNNARFADPRAEPLPADGSLDLVTTFDCIHDMTHPFEVMQAIRGAVRDDGAWLLVDIKGRDTFGENVEKNPMASLMYGISVLSCMSSALSEPDGAGLGTLGLPEKVAARMASDAGFTRFRKLDVDHAVNAFYEVRP